MVAQYVIQFRFFKLYWNQLHYIHQETYHSQSSNQNMNVWRKWWDLLLLKLTHAFSERKHSWCPMICGLKMRYYSLIKIGFFNKTAVFVNRTRPISSFKIRPNQLLIIVVNNFLYTSNHCKIARYKNKLFMWYCVKDNHTAWWSVI